MDVLLCEIMGRLIGNESGFYGGEILASWRRRYLVLCEAVNEVTGRLFLSAIVRAW